MTDEVDTSVDNGGDAPDVTDTGGATETPEAVNTPEETSDFAIPDEYKDRSWASKIKSQDDVYKQIDNLNELIGKKTITPIDYENSTPEDIAAYHKSIVPENADAYTFGEDSDTAFTSAIVPALQEAGIHPAQLAILEPAINKAASDIVGAQYETDRSEDGYFDLSKEAFGDNYKDTIVELESAYKEHVPESVKQYLDNASNQDRSMFDQTVKSILDAKNAEINKLRAEYGAEETGLQGEGEAASSKRSIDDLIKDKREELAKLDGKAGARDFAAINAIKDEIQQLYQKKVKQK